MKIQIPLQQQKRIVISTNQQLFIRKRNVSMLQIQREELFSDKFLAFNDDLEFEYSKTIAPRRHEEPSIEFSFILDKLTQSSNIEANILSDQINFKQAGIMRDHIYYRQSSELTNENTPEIKILEEKQSRKPIMFRINRCRSLSNRSELYRKIGSKNSQKLSHSQSGKTECSEKIIKTERFQSIENETRKRSHHLEKGKFTNRELENQCQLEFQKSILMAKKKPLNQRKRLFQVRKQTKDPIN